MNLSQMRTIMRLSCKNRECNQCPFYQDVNCSFVSDKKMQRLYKKIKSDKVEELTEKEIDILIDFLLSGYEYIYTDNNYIIVTTKNPLIKEKIKKDDSYNILNELQHTKISTLLYKD